MITEDYVSFEIAKLLKEKGFDVYVRSYYEKDKYKTKEELYINVAHWNWNISSFRYSAPTLQMAMKWLREIHRIDIEVRTHYLNYLKPNDIRYYSGKILKGSEDVVYTIYAKDTNEEVCEAAIKYCLENLI